eukprot:gene8310-9872_t
MHPWEGVEAAVATLHKDFAAAFGTTMPGISEAASEASHLRAPTIAWLLSFIAEHDCWMWRTWQVVMDIVIPRTANLVQCRFTELPEAAGHFGAADTFASHCWSAKWGTLETTLAEFRDHNRRVWIDCSRSVSGAPRNRADLVFA